MTELGASILRAPALNQQADITTVSKTERRDFAYQNADQAEKRSSFEGRLAIPSSSSALASISNPSLSSPLSNRSKRSLQTSEEYSDEHPGKKQKMPSHSPRSHSPTSRKHSSKSKGSGKGKGKGKSDDWTDVTEPDERRRIQNRLAQRKFREKAKEQKEQAERDSQNQQYAGSSYRTLASVGDFNAYEDDATSLSGLPWGGISMSHVVTRGSHGGGHYWSGGDGDGDEVEEDHDEHNTGYNNYGFSYGHGDDAQYQDQDQDDQEGGRHAYGGGGQMGPYSTATTAAGYYHSYGSGDDQYYDNRSHSSSSAAGTTATSSHYYYDFGGSPPGSH